MFLDVLVGQLVQLLPAATRPPKAAPSPERSCPAASRSAPTNRFDGGANIAYQDQKRYKPQFTASLSYFKDGWHGSHDFKFGARRPPRTAELLRAAAVQSRLLHATGGLGRTPQEIEFYNTPNTGINQTNNVSAYVNDTWRFNNKLTLNLGLRVDYYKDVWPEQSVTPEGVPGLIGVVTDANLRALWTPFTVPQTDLRELDHGGPRAGFAYDLTGDGKSVIKGFYGRFYFNSAPDTIAAIVNPVGRTRLRYRWTDLNGNLLIDNPAELGAFLRTVTGSLPGAAGVTVDPNLKRPYGDEVSTHFEQEIVAGAVGRARRTSTRTSATSGRRRRQPARCLHRPVLVCRTSVPTTFAAPPTIRR